MYVYGCKNFQLPGGVVKFLSGVAVALLLIAVASSGCSSAKGSPTEIPNPDDPQPEADFRAAPLDLNAPFLREPVVEEGAYEFQPGDTFLGAMNRLGAPRAEAREVAYALEERCGLDRIRPGWEFTGKIREGEGLQSFRFPCGPYEIVNVSFDGAEPIIDIEEIPHQEAQRVYVAQVKRNSSLIASAVEEGISAGQVIELARIFRSDIDFNNDIHPGDELRLWVEEVQDDQGRTLNSGKILAALLILDGKEYWAIYYNGGGKRGYYDKDGWSLKKSFLKSPLPFLRVTSGFTLRRFHPVLGKQRPHYGVDFGAPTGTPVMAAADGRVIHSGWINGYGKCVKIRHSPRLVTLYAHLSKILVNKGQYVRQGDTIGRVGATGLVTGPHLHYGMYRNGRPVDPMSVKMETTDVARSAGFRRCRDRAMEILSNPVPRNIN